MSGKQRRNSNVTTTATITTMGATSTTTTTTTTSSSIQHGYTYSGRGRPRTKDLVVVAVEDRPLPVGIVLPPPSSMNSPDLLLFQNRKIRVGGPFQAKVPKFCAVQYQSRRPTPSRVSWLHPHLTQHQVDDYERHQQNQQQQEDASQSNPQEETSPTANTDADGSITQMITTSFDSSASVNSNSNMTNGSLKTCATTDRQQQQQQQQQNQNENGSTANDTNGDDNNNNSNNNTNNTTTNNNNNNNEDDNDDEEDDEEAEDCFVTKRGGLLICPAEASMVLSTTTTTTTNNNDTRTSSDFWDFVKPLLLPVATNSQSAIAAANTNNNYWQSQILQWHFDKQQRQQDTQRKLQEALLLAQQQQEEEQQLPKRRGRRKRKKDVSVEQLLETQQQQQQQPMVEETILEWYSTNIQQPPQQQQQQQQSSNHKRPRTMGYHQELAHEERAQAMQHLWLRHRGAQAAAKFETIVQLSAGKADMARKLRQHKRRKQLKTDTTADQQTKISWRLRCEKSNSTCMMGDFRDHYSSSSESTMEAKYPVLFGTTTARGNHYESENTYCNKEEVTDVEVQKEIWKAILACGRAIEEELAKGGSSGSANNDNKADITSFPKLSLLLSFLNNASQVRPIPEDIFRAPSVPPEINNCMNNIMDFVDKAKKVQAQITDAIYETYHGGVDLDALQKLLEQSGRPLSVELDDVAELNRQVELACNWQQRLDALVGESELSLSSLEDLAQEGRRFAFRTRSLVQLESRIHKAYLLRDRIEEWKKSCIQDEENLDDKKEGVKFLGAMVRDANRLKLVFPEVSELLETHRSVEAWIDRANIAIRSRISLAEVKALLEAGEETPVDLSDLLEKLRARVSLAEEWLDRFKEVVPCPDPLPTSDTVPSDNIMLLWMARMRDALFDGNYSVLHDLASEGSRIPVEVDIVKLLQIELDAKSWTMKARKWIPSLAKDDTITCKRGKLEDLREHMEKAAVLREKLDLPATIKDVWVLEGEKEIRSIVQAADDWFQQYKPYLDWDNRRNEGRSCLSLDKLRAIVDEGTSIHANIGSAIGKMSRILAQAEGWLEEYEPILLRCKMIKDDDCTLPPHFFVTLQQMTAAAQAASSDVSLDLDEAKALERLVENVKDWSSRVLIAAPKRSKRQGRGRKAKYSVDDIIGLINEASNLPVDTSEDVNRLQIQLSAIQEWRTKARQELEEISNGFQKLRLVVDEMYGPPNEYTRTNNDKGEEPVDDEAASINEEKKVTEDMSVCETSSNAGSEEDNTEGFSQLGNGSCNVNQLIKAYRREAKSFGVISGEVEAADQLEKISNWCVRSLKYLINQRDVFDKRFFGAFDRFVAEGRELVSPTGGEDDIGVTIMLDDQPFADALNSSWMAFVSDQLQRLKTLLVNRERFITWCNTSDELLFSDEKRPSLEVLKDVADQSRDFPSVCDMVQKVRGLYNKAMEWKDSIIRILKDGEKLSRQEAKEMLDVGEKLGFMCDELKVLRNAQRAARNWAARAKRCKVEQGSTNATAVQDLIDEHDALLLEMPEELSRLQQAVKRYCLCRRPYLGFMIGCDECDEWYHGSCIGISESKADKVDKFVCVRCNLSRAFKGSAKDAVSVVRKWTNQKDMKKARQTEAQKHQRKVRKETKEIEKLREKIEELESMLLHTASSGSEELEPELEPQPTIVDTVSQETKKEDSSNLDNTENDSKPVTPHISPEEATIKIEKALESIRQSEERLSHLGKKADEYKAITIMEDAKGPFLRNWCLRVRSLVLFPRSNEVAEESRPLEDGSLSRVMNELIEETEKLGIACVTDVSFVINSFRCMCWCLRASSILARKPSFEEIELLVSQARTLKFTEEKALRSIKNIFNRAKSWQSKVLKTLAPVPGETKAFNLDALKELETAAEDIPVYLKEEALLLGVIDDNGERHCVCGGPSDARFMLSCDKCENWFHGPCVKISSEECDEIKKWICPPCSGSKPNLSMSLCSIVWDEPDDQSHRKELEEDVSSEAPDVSKMWPPFGLFDSQSALEVMGEECRDIPDVSSSEIQAQMEAQIANSRTYTVQSAGLPKQDWSHSISPTPPDNTESFTSEGSTQAHGTSAAVSTGSETHPTLHGFSGAFATQAAGAVHKPFVELPQQQAFDWLAQSGDLSGLNAAALAAAAAQQISIDPVQLQAYASWQHSALMDASAATAATPTASDMNIELCVPNSNHSEAMQIEEPQNEKQTSSALPTVLHAPQTVQAIFKREAIESSEDHKNDQDPSAALPHIAHSLQTQKAEEVSEEPREDRQHDPPVFHAAQTENANSNGNETKQTSELPKENCDKIHHPSTALPPVFHAPHADNIEMEKAPPHSAPSAVRNDVRAQKPGESSLGIPASVNLNIHGEYDLEAAISRSPPSEQLNGVSVMVAALPVQDSGR